MTEQELLHRERIRHTMATYTTAGDRLQTDTFVAVFTDDAVLETEGVPDGDAFRYEGKQAIRAWMDRWREPGASRNTVHQATFVRHHLATCLIEFVDDTTAKARTYWTAYTNIGPDHAGVYVDRFQRDGDHWLIAHRRIRLDWRSPDSLMFSAIARSKQRG